MMLQQLLAGQTPGFVLLLLGLKILISLLPSILAFSRARRPFTAILVMNLILSLTASILSARISPSGAAVPVASPVLAVSALAVIAAWIGLIVWALMPGEPDPRLLRAQDTKLYDAVAALPLVLWFGYGAWQLRSVLANDLRLMLAGGSPFVWVQFFALTAAAGFDLLLVYLLLVRDKPVRRSRGAWGRIFAVIGTFLGVGMLQLHPVPLSPGLQILSAVLVGVGSLGSLLVLSRLGKAFSIMPEARTLVTGGPYAYARHPLYGVEIISIAGTAMLFQQPWAALIGIGVVALLVIRSLFEEQVLSEAYPEYALYQVRTKRFIPGVI